MDSEEMCIDSCVEETRRSIVGEQLDLSEKFIAELLDSISRLSKKLEPVMGPQLPTPESATKNPGELIVPLASCLSLNNSKIKGARRAIENLIERIAL